jgi:RNA-directed DNA polymerase
VTALDFRSVPLSKDELAARLSAYLRHAVDHGYSVKPAALAQRCKGFYPDLSAAIRQLAADLEYEDSDWRKWRVERLQQWIEISDTLGALFDAGDDGGDDDMWERDAPDEVFAEAPRLATLVVRESIHPLPRVSANRRRALSERSDDLPSIADRGELARLLEVSLDEFEEAFRAPYRLSVMRKASGHARLLEIPPPLLLVLQRRLLRRILDRVRVHECAHGFVRGRGVRTHAAVHAGRAMVIRMDLKDFFPSTGGARIFLLFRGLGYNVDVANHLTRLCVTQRSWWQLQNALRSESHDSLRALNEKFGVNHLPQGAPTSPTLANLCAFTLDQRLSAFAETFGATYTRYADDLVFSGDARFATRYRNFVATARTIIAEEGWQINAEKFRAMRQSARQSFTGVVVNERPNIARHDYDALKARVHRFVSALAGNSREQSTQQRQQLLGQIAWLAQFNASRANKLREKLNAACTAHGMFAKSESTS